MRVVDDSETNGEVSVLIGGETLGQIHARQEGYQALADLTGSMNPGFVVKDSGARESFASGMVRDTEEGKVDYTLVRKGPMYRRWAEHMTKGAVKYGRHNWTNACSEEEYERFKRSALRHFEDWLDGKRDEDHGAAVMFNINAAEYVRERAF